MQMLGFPVDLWRITGADFIVRTTYQMGKTPLLPLYAAALGASDMMIGQVVSISTLTGLMLKPIFGLLSDRTGRRLWLFLGLGLFTLTPFLYRFVETPEQLFALRLFHGIFNQGLFDRLPHVALRLVQFNSHQLCQEPVVKQVHFPVEQTFIVSRKLVSIDSSLHLQYGRQCIRIERTLALGIKQ